MSREAILLLGDGSNLLKMIGWVLEYKGFAVKAATSPEAALETLVKKNYDMIIAKVSAADRETMDILKRAKRLNPEVKLMVVSGKGEAIFPLEAYEVEVDDYILMPTTPVDLWRRVNQCLEPGEVVDLQPVPVTPESAAAPDRIDHAQPHTMLMFHDIRGTMVATAATLKLLARGTYGSMSAEALTKVHEASGRMETLIQQTDGFLGKTLGEYRSRQEGRDILDLKTDIVDPVLSELSREIRDHGITLINRLAHRQEGEISVRGNQFWLKSIFRNLITNGIKYGGDGCTIAVDFEADGSNCHLNVHNSGRTVPEAFRTMLFSYGAKMRQSRKGREGLGLGLSLSRDILQHNNGDIWYEAKTDGSNFVVSLPQQ
jgi:DNA-binding response OmpR family regulator